MSIVSLVRCYATTHKWSPWAGYKYVLFLFYLAVLISISRDLRAQKPHGESKTDRNIENFPRPHFPSPPGSQLIRARSARLCSLRSRQNMTGPCPVLQCPTFTPILATPLMLRLGHWRSTGRLWEMPHNGGKGGKCRGKTIDDCSNVH